jgi:AcrR family transcriptional regulator
MPSKRLQPRKDPRQERAIETRGRLLAAAARVFSEHGYSAGTTNRIAEAAGHSIGSLYQYFPNKDAILAELVTAHAKAGIAAITRQLDAGLPDSLEDKLRLFVRTAMDNHRDDPALHRVLFEEAPHPPELLALLHTAEEQAIATACSLLSADPQVRVIDVAMAARLTVNSIESLVHRFYSSGEPHEAERFENELVAMLHSYLTAGGTLRPPGDTCSACSCP